VNKKLCIHFLNQLLHQIRRPIILVWDRSPSHTAKDTKVFPRLHRKRIRVYWLPAYAPDLNPDEYVWSYVKKSKLANYCPHNLQELELAAESAMESLRRKPSMVKSFFHAAKLERDKSTYQRKHQ
jgi:transposase